MQWIFTCHLFCATFTRGWRRKDNNILASLRQRGKNHDLQPFISNEIRPFFFKRPTADLPSTWPNDASVEQAHGGGSATEVRKPQGPWAGNYDVATLPPAPRISVVSSVTPGRALAAPKQVWQSYRRAQELPDLLTLAHAKGTLA